MLRSSDVLNTLFHDSAIITEGGDDKVIYQEANSKLLQYNRGIRNTIFLNANGKQVITRMVRPLRKIGLTVAAIYDLDVLKEETKVKGETLWSSILNSFNVDPSELNYYHTERRYLE